MYCIKLTTLVLGILTVSVSHVGCQEEPTPVNAFDVVRTYLGVTTPKLRETDTARIIEEVIYRVGCHNQGVDCSSCAPPQAVLRYVNDNTTFTLNEEGYYKLSVVLIVFMQNMTSECALSASTLQPNGRTFPEFLLMLCEADELHINLHEMEELLERIERYYNLGVPNLFNSVYNQDVTFTIDYTKEIQCFSAASLLEELQIHGTPEVIGEHDIRRLAGLIISHILQGHCVSPRNLPSRHSFIASLMQRIGSNGKISLDGLEQLMTELGIGGEEDGHAGETGVDTHDDHRRKRDTGIEIAVPDVLLRTKRALRDTVVAEETKSRVNVNDTCYSGEDLIQIYTGSEIGVLDVDEFTALCPSLLQQYLSNACIPEEAQPIPQWTAEVWGYATISVFLITLCTLAGAPFLKIRNRRARLYLLAGMMSLSVGTLVGDAILHLIPVAVGLHKHEGHSDTEGIVVSPYVLKLVMVLVSIYVFYIIQVIMTTTLGGHGHSHGEVHESEMEKHDKHSHSNGTSTPTTTMSITESVSGLVAVDDHPNLELQGVKYPVHGTLSPHIEIGDVEKKKLPKPKYKLTPMALMVMLGDSLHNFADGLAIGAAFSLNINSGISTSIAVFCHELPHELGDFAALIASGMSIKRAMIMNFISGLSAFIGLYIGIAISTQDEAREWVFAIAAGMFIYVALVNIVPELMNFYKGAKFTYMFISQNVGLILGMTIMLLIAIFESKIKV